jgi:hypothetical protein
MERTKQSKTVNQLLEILHDRFSFEELNSNSKLKKIREKLIEIKLKTINGGKVMVENTDEISNLMVKP